MHRVLLTQHKVRWSELVIHCKHVPHHFDAGLMRSEEFLGPLCSILRAAMTKELNVAASTCGSSVVHTILERLKMGISFRDAPCCLEHPLPAIDQPRAFKYVFGSTSICCFNHVHNLKHDAILLLCFLTRSWYIHDAPAEWYAR